MRSFAVEYPKFLVSDLLGSVLRFPLWWFGDGAVHLMTWIMGRLTFRWKSYDFVIWIRNLFVPMYGQYDLTGRFVSFLMRVAVLIARFIAFIVEVLGYAVLLLIYISAPVLAVLLCILNVGARL